MKVLFVLSGNNDKTSGPVFNQASSIQRYAGDIEIEMFLVKGKGISGYLQNIRQLRKKIKALNPDLIHAHYSFCGFLSVLSFTGKPVITSLMGSDLHLKMHWRMMVMVMSLFWKAIIIKSKAMQKNYFFAKTLIIPNGVDFLKYPEIEKKRAREFLGLSAEKTYVLFLADPQRKEKNFRLTEEAFQALGMPNSELLVKYGIPHEQTRLYYYAVDVLALSSIYEGSPNVIKEALVCNCPVVSTPVGDVEILFGGSEGNYIAGPDVVLFSEKMKEAIRFSKEKNRTNGRQRIIELGLDAETVTAKIKSLYKSVTA
jgi:glycosyltransferase involved in cell wall biosynthesis